MRGIRTLRVSTEKNSIRKEMMTLSLLENITNAKAIRDSIPKKIQFQDRRNFLELVIKNHVLELQNIEMEINLQIQEKTILDLKNIVESQRTIIQENHLLNDKSEEGLNAVDNEIDLYDEDLDEEFDDEEDEDDEDDEEGDG